MTSGFLAILDDIAVLMDDVLILSKSATEKTAGILADDLAINADKASGFISSRELPVLWQLTKGSFLNKVIILPAIFLLSAYLPGAIVPILICGGVYLSFEGALNVYKIISFSKQKRGKVSVIKNENPSTLEAKKVKSAILIDFILSIEIIIITLGTVMDQPLKLQIPVVTIVALLSTIGVYGFVALLVRMDDLGYRIIASSNSIFMKKTGSVLVKSLPKIIRFLKLIGTVAMIIVGGGIFVHNIEPIHHYVHEWPVYLADFIIGLCFGSVFLFVYLLFTKLNIFRKPNP